MQTKKEIFNQLTFLSSLYPSTKVESGTLNAMTELLSREFTVEQIKIGIVSASKRCKFFPSYAELYEIINPPVQMRDEANELAGVILDAIRNRSTETLDAVCLLAIERFGGIKVLRMTETDQLPTVRAQLRDTVQSILAMKNRSPELEKLDYQKQTRQALESREQAPLKKISDTLSGVLTQITK